MRIVTALEDWAIMGPMIRRVLAWVLLWPLLLVLRVPVRSGLAQRRQMRADPENLASSQRRAGSRL